jgi:ribosomal protein S27AE
MREIQRCRKCGHVFAKIDRSGPSIGGMGDIMRHSDDRVCPRCGGSVIWVDEGGSPLSAYKRMEEANRHLRLACLWGAIALIGWLIIYFVLR